MGCFSSKDAMSVATVVPDQLVPERAISSDAAPILVGLTRENSIESQAVGDLTPSQGPRRVQKLVRKGAPDSFNSFGVLPELECEKTITLCSLDERKRLHRALRKNFLFCRLAEADSDGMIDQMEKIALTAGSIVFKQGDAGDSCYIILVGAVSVSINGRVIKELRKGETFGELAMLYDCERSASITCLNDPVTLFKISGRSMRRYMSIINERNQKKIIKFLNNEETFSCCSEADKELLASICHVQEFSEGEVFMREGEKGECIFLVMSGKAETMDKFGNRRQVKQGAIIGELGFARTAAHAYCARATTKITLLSFSTECLKATFGSLHGVLHTSALKSILSRGTFFNLLTEAQQNAIVNKFEGITCEQGLYVVTKDSNPQLIIVMEGSCALLDACDRRETKSNSMDDAFLETVKSDAVSNFGPRDICGEENLSSGEPMRGSIIVTSAITKVQRIGLEQLLEACTEGDMERTRIKNLKDLLRLNAIRSALSGILVFKTITKEQLDMVAFALKDQTFDANEVIYRQGDSVTDEAGLFLISEGSVRIDVDAKTVRTCARWDYFGERALLLQDKRSATCSAGSKGCHCLVLDKPSFLEIVGKFRAVLEHRIKLQDTNVKFDDLKSVAVVGRGTFGVVKLVEHKDDPSKRYALKCIDKKAGVRLKQQNFLAVEREINALCFHPCIMQFIRTFQDSKCIYFLTEFLGGGDLFSAIREIGMLSKNQIMFFTGSIILAIEYLHERNIMYRDLKPENVLLDEEGTTKLVDFGCCRQATRTYTLVGTPEYLAPEVVLARGYTCTADWWSLGVMLYEFCCGPLPFGRDLDDQLELYREILEAPLEFPDYVTDVLGRDLMYSLLEKNPKRRLCGARGAKEIKAHEYFKHFDWNALACGYMDRPWKPNTEQAKKQWEPVSIEDSICGSNDEEYTPEPWCAHF